MTARNKPDPETLADMVADLDAHSGHPSQKTVVMDAGIATEDNLSLLRQKGYHYVCVSRKRLADYQLSGQEMVKQSTNRGESEVRLSVFHPQGQPDTWMYVQSDLKRSKEQSMKHKLGERFEKDLEEIRASLGKKGGTKKVEKVWERIGRAKQRHLNVSGSYHITISQEDGKATDLHWERKQQTRKQDKEEGIYFIRTSYQNPSEEQLWKIYDTIREVEATFRCLKTDLQVRPVYHQKDERVEAHIYLTLLAYQLVNTIRHMLKENGITYDWRNILSIMHTHTIQTVEAPAETKTIYLRKPSKPIADAQEIYRATGCNQQQKVTRKYVVYH